MKKKNKLLRKKLNKRESQLKKQRRRDLKNSSENKSKKKEEDKEAFKSDILKANKNVEGKLIQAIVEHNTICANDSDKIISDIDIGNA